MPNPLFNQMGNGQFPGQMGHMLNAFQQFKANFHGDAQQEVQRLLNTGQMSQAQYNQLAQAAQQIARMMQGR